MDEEHVKPIRLKALVDKEREKVIFAEPSVEFIDVLFSFLTMPMGTIIRLILNRPPTMGIGCMNNLYECIENLDVQLFRTEECKKMLLYPRNAAADQCRRLKLNIDETEPLRYFLGERSDCPHLSHYRDVICPCGECINMKMFLPEKTYFAQDRGVFVKKITRLMISDELRVMPPSTEESLSLLSNLGLTDGSTTEERNLDIGVDEVLTLLKMSLVSKTALTGTFLKCSPTPELDQMFFDIGKYIKSGMEELTSDVSEKPITIKLTVCKSKKMVGYAETSGDFVDLLFSFLTVPLGYAVEEMHTDTWKGCINHLYNSIRELDAEQYLKSNEHKAMLLSPQLAPSFGYENHPLGIEEDKHPPYYYVYADDKLISDETLLPSGEDEYLALTVLDPNSSSEDTRGFVKRAEKFMVTDNLKITPASSISGLSNLTKHNVDWSDIEVRTVHVGHKEALRLLVASLVSKSALTVAFLGEPNSEQSE
ncbi:uncharacterized protein LOC116124565 [Pistacia vera]|uniref:uncharacterized protein LOC116124565 n=1 Tax=Pistacia vera TaxID=55513 RepID=UPI001263BABD|nr:uncharacterized protein LOC116124565 [Pistacia vera]